MMEERLRQGQAETENRLVMMKAYQGATGNMGENPLNEFFANDKEVMRLDVDANAQKELICNSYLHSPLCFLPCFWPHSIILCMPLSVCYQRRMADEAARAHRLILKERCLVLEVDSYSSMMRSSTATMIPCACCCSGNCVPPTRPIKETIPLEDIKSCGVETCKAQMCGSNVAADTFVVRLKNGIQFPLFAIDCPGRNAQQFAEQLMTQVNACTANPSALPVGWNNYKKKIGGAGMMGAGMARMQMQMQMMQQGGVHQQQMMNQQMLGMQMGNMGVTSVPAAQNMTRGGVVTATGVPHISPAHPPAAHAAIPVAEAHQEDDAATKIQKLANLKAQGILSEDEFNAAKKAILGNL